MKKLCLILISLLVVIPFALAQDELEGIEAGITPDRPLLYGIDKALDSMKMSIARFRGPEHASRVRLQVAQERLMEVRLMIQEKKQVFAEIAEQERVKTIQGLKLGIEKMDESQKEHVQAMISKHLEKVNQIRLTPSLEAQMPGLKENLNAGLEMTKSVRENIKTRITNGN